ncbi:MAG: hypothetical protein M4D80_10035 [Myxococcota bacterium]|nr:hypothetical protein [Myxococcota bacterium]
MSASDRTRDKPGPHPENQRKRTEIRGPRHALIGVLVCAAIGMVIVGIMLIQGADGRAVRLSPELLAGSPFGSFREIGLMLAILIGGTQAVAATLFALHHPRARHVAAVAAGIAVACGAAFVLAMHRTSWLEPTLFGIGFLELLLVAGCTPRKSAHPKHRFGQ